MNPQDLLFTKDHEWIETGKPVARVGVSDYAQKELTDVVYVELPAEGTAVQPGDSIATLESVKATSDVYAPAAGTITAVNVELEDSPQKINEDPYGAGWLVEIEISDPAPLGDLMNYDAYQKYLEAKSE